MSTSFTGPIRIYKYNNPTNNGVIAPDNTGAARVSQQSYITNPITATTVGATTLTTADVGSTSVTPFVLPAGAIIEGVTLYQDVAAGGLVGGVITVSIVQTNPTTGANTTTAIGTITPTAAGGRIAGVFTATAATAAILALPFHPHCLRSTGSFPAGWLTEQMRRVRCTRQSQTAPVRPPLPPGLRQPGLHIGKWHCRHLRKN